ncbi:hypothetical protein PF005_g19775 [Phytophthora fragariae]|uniref:PiggyBac transposable element-derived protein domain-containing protein n=1 Tax=Phytophthora fragariae TaxID=53985 RepID=A0A6A3R2B1_9STRA|nr:hypothetical protein PF003_g38525 [Phytophthora fragariae]KAE8928936.1 hypothetical protein PF009_g20939 [Phytophthora fragariae]KAE9086029.1 hypothetical protein PF010_g20243 [Phytophthora fragariae]KAE9088324.1 hypothetical protein PF007_g20018 [Phytophthora fragariae]KAE9091818.1 hypothetical protein PF006_g24838 [Phytophthora fragariae]
MKRDPAARIWCLLNLLKVTGGKYIDLGRNVALDEASVGCRSRFGRHLIVYNPKTLQESATSKCTCCAVRPRG